jgi:16S rRNA (guanine527-N7)-methyltransferase
VTRAATTIPQPSSATAPPPAALARFGDRLDLACRYADLLCTTGVVRGLIGPREPERIWDRHLLNSAALADLVPAHAEVVDLGSGAGLPGVPLVIARPDLRIRLVEPMQRRTEFLHEVVATLGLRAEVVRARAEDLDAASADVVVARAVAPLKRLLPLAMPLLRPHGVLLALKGQGAYDEIARAEPISGQWPDIVLEVATVGEDTATTTVVRVTRGRGVAAPGGTKSLDGP